MKRLSLFLMFFLVVPFLLQSSDANNNNATKESLLENIKNIQEYIPANKDRTVLAIEKSFHPLYQLAAFISEALKPKKLPPCHNNNHTAIEMHKIMYRRSLTEAAVTTGFISLIYKDILKTVPLYQRCALLTCIFGMRYRTILKFCSKSLKSQAIENNLQNSSINNLFNKIRTEEQSSKSLVLCDIKHSSFTKYSYLAACAGMMILSLPTGLQIKNSIPLGIALYSMSPVIDSYFGKKPQALPLTCAEAKTLYYKMQKHFVTRPAAIDIGTTLFTTGLTASLVYGFLQNNPHPLKKYLLIPTTALFGYTYYRGAMLSFHVNSIYNTLKDTNNNSSCTVIENGQEKVFDSYLYRKDLPINSPLRNYNNTFDNWIDNHILEIGLGATAALYVGCWYKGKQGVLPFDGYAANDFDTIAEKVVNPLCNTISYGCTKGLEKATAALSKMPFFNR